MHFQGVIFDYSKEMTTGIKENRPAGETQFHALFLER